MVAAVQRMSIVMSRFVPRVVSKVMVKVYLSQWWNLVEGCLKGHGKGLDEIDVGGVVKATSL